MRGEHSTISSTSVDYPIELLGLNELQLPTVNFRVVSSFFACVKQLDFAKRVDQHRKLC